MEIDIQRWSQIIINSFKIDSYRGGKTYELQSQNIGGKDAQELVRAITGHQTNIPPSNRLMINLYGNNIQTLGCSYLSKAILNISYLNLSFNRIGDEGCRYLSRANWNQLECLGLMDNGITTKGCLQLSQAPWNIIDELGIWQNKIEKQGFLLLTSRKWKVYCDLEYQQEEYSRNDY